MLREYAMKRTVIVLILLALVFPLVLCEKEFKPVTVEELVAAYEAEGYTVVDISDTIGTIPDEEPYSLISEMYMYNLGDDNGEMLGYCVFDNVENAKDYFDFIAQNIQDVIERHNIDKWYCDIDEKNNYTYCYSYTGDISISILHENIIIFAASSSCDESIDDALKKLGYLLIVRPKVIQYQ